MMISFDRENKVIKDFLKKTGFTDVAFIKRALSTYIMLKNTVLDNPDQKVAILDKNNKPIKEIIIP